MATWWRKPDGTRMLVLDVNSPEGVEDEYGCAAIEMTPDVARQILQRMDRFTAWKQQEPELASLRFWDYQPEYYGRTWGDDVEDEDGNGPPQWVRGDWSGRTELDRMSVAESWAEWSAYVKNTDLRLVTETLNRQELERFLAGDDPWPEPVAGPVGMQEG